MGAYIRDELCELNTDASNPRRCSVGGLITPPILLGGAAGAALSPSDQQYLISACLIWCAFGTCLQVSRIRLPFGYTIGSGVLTVTGTSFAFVSVGLTFINGQYKADGTGMCQLDAAGDKLPCREVYGAFLGTATVVAIIAIALSFLPPRVIKKVSRALSHSVGCVLTELEQAFPPLISGMVLLLIGATLVRSGINNWAGGQGACMSDFTQLCPSNDAPMAAPWGSARLIGLGFLVFACIVLFDLLGPPIVQNTSVFLGLLIGLIVSAACGYFEGATIRAAPIATFNWTTTFPLSVRGDLVLPFIAAYLVILSETIGECP